MNFADLDSQFKETPPELVGMYPLGGGGLIEAPYRAYFETKHLKRIVRFTKDMNVLELGSGNGRWAVALAPLVRSYTGVDITRRAVEISRDVAEKHGLSNTMFHEMSILDFKGDQPYDVIYFSAVSQYLEDHELRRVLSNLQRWMKGSTVIVDRSTVSLVERHSLRRENYFSIFRPAFELNTILKEFGFQLRYQARSYRFLRISRRLLASRFAPRIPRLVRSCAPVSLYLMLLYSAVKDRFRPLLFEGGRQSHDFMLFTRAEN